MVGAAAPAPPFILRIEGVTTRSLTAILKR
jgi:hypothetical protein